MFEPARTGNALKLHVWISAVFVVYRLRGALWFDTSISQAS